MKLYKSGLLFQADKQTERELELARVAPELVPLKVISVVPK